MTSEQDYADKAAREWLDNTFKDRNPAYQRKVLARIIRSTLREEATEAWAAYSGTQLVTNSLRYEEPQGLLLASWQLQKFTVGRVLVLFEAGERTE